MKVNLKILILVGVLKKKLIIECKKSTFPPNNPLSIIVINLSSSSQSYPNSRHSSGVQSNTMPQLVSSNNNLNSKQLLKLDTSKKYKYDDNQLSPFNMNGNFPSNPISRNSESKQINSNYSRNNSFNRTHQILKPISMSTKKFKSKVVGVQGEYTCEHCLIKFPDSILYGLHMGQHCVAEPFKCNICSNHSMVFSVFHLPYLSGSY